MDSDQQVYVCCSKNVLHVFSLSWTTQGLIQALVHIRVVFVSQIVTVVDVLAKNLIVFYTV